MSDTVYTGHAFGAGEQPGEAFAAGQLVGGKYKILSVLGHGGMGTVYKVQQVFLNIELALKVLDGKRIVDEAQLRRFQVEAKAAYSLSHPNIIKVLDFGLLENERPYLVMEIANGISLAEYIKKYGPMQPDKATVVFAQASRGLAQAHEHKVIHRDIKPGNIMVPDSQSMPESGAVKIVDFGIAKVCSHDDGEIQALTKTGEIFGSPFYMSPEQCSGLVIDARTDIYSLGCAFFEALTGTPPFVGVNALRTMMLHQSEQAPRMSEASMGVKFPDSLEAIVHRMLEKDPTLRYQSMDDVASALSKPARADGGRGAIAKAAAVKKPKGVTFVMTLPKLLALCAVLICFSAAVSILAIRQLGSNKHNDAAESSAPPKSAIAHLDIPDIPPNGYTPVPPQKIDLAQIPTITSRLNSRGMKSFKFPVAFGKIAYRPDERRTAFKEVLATGDVEVPEAVGLELKLGGDFNDVYRQPELLAKIGDREFTSLQLTKTEYLAGRSEQNVSPVALDKILQIAATWKYLDSLKIDDATMDDKGMRLINSFPHLLTLDLNHVRFSQPDGVIPLQKTQFLNIQNMDAFRVFDPHGQLSALESLSLDHSSMNDENAHAIALMPHLERLQFGYIPISERQCNEISRSKSVKHLVLVNVPINRVKLGILLKMPALESLELKGNSGRQLDRSIFNDSRVHFSS